MVVNAGYVYDSTIMERLSTRLGWKVRELTKSDLVQVLEDPGIERELEVATALARAKSVLANDDCDVTVKAFEPDSVPAILLRDSDGESRRRLDHERESAPGLWNGLLDSFAEEAPEHSRTLVLNDKCPVSRMLLAADQANVFDAGLQSLYLSAVMLAGDGLNSTEAGSLTDSLGVLLATSLNTSMSNGSGDSGLPEQK